jgi:hypothetical protein
LLAGAGGRIEFRVRATGPSSPTPQLAASNMIRRVPHFRDGRFSVAPIALSEPAPGRSRFACGPQQPCRPSKHSCFLTQPIGASVITLVIQVAVAQLRCPQVRTWGVATARFRVGRNGFSSRPTLQMVHQEPTLGVSGTCVNRSSLNAAILHGAKPESPMHKPPPDREA